MSKSKITLLVLAGIVSIFIVSGIYLGWYRAFMPQMEDARHDVFKQTQSYIDGKITHLNRLKLDYQTKGEGHRGALRNMILTEASTVDRSKLPSDLRRFIETLE